MKRMVIVGRTIMKMKMVVLALMAWGGTQREMLHGWGTSS